MALSFETRNVVKATVLRGRPLTVPITDPELAAAQYGAAFVQPRYTPEVWMSLLEISTRATRCISAVARAAVGLGICAEPDTAAGRNHGRAAQRDADELAQLVRRPNASLTETLRTVLYKAEYDLQGSGNGILEVAEVEREAGAKVVGLIHVPCVNVRVSKWRDRYARTFGTPTSSVTTGSVRVVRAGNPVGSIVYYRRFGDDDPERRFIDRLTGEFHAEWPKGLSEDRRGTALLHVKSYCPLDDFYGQPAFATAVNAVVGNFLKGTWNVNFLENSAHVPFVILVKNGNLSPDSVEQIELFLSREGTGAKNAGRVMILQPDLTKLVGGGNINIEIVPLKVGVSDDASFLEYGDSNDKEIQEAVGVPDVFIGGGGGTNMTVRNAGTTRQVAQEHLFGPRTDEWEDILNGAIAARVGGGRASFRFTRPNSLDALQIASFAQKLSDGLTISDLTRVARRYLADDVEPPKDDSQNTVPLALLKESLKAQGVQQVFVPRDDGAGGVKLHAL